ncbi:MAG: methyltransferase domain-containing protein [Ilumatobacteraceae bacterium]
MGNITARHYLAGVVGLSLVRHWHGDPAANAARVDELLTILTGPDEFPWNIVLDPRERDLSAGYEEWAPTYDGRNPLIEAEEVLTHPLLARLGGPGTRALDAACGTGRHAAFIASLGGDVTGIDRSPHMLDVALEKVDGADFVQGKLERMPFADDEFDLAIVSLALCHLPDPTVAVGELGRVTRPGRTVVITDPHPVSGLVGGQAFYGGFGSTTPSGEPAGMRYVRNHDHSAATWLRAFRSAGLSVVDCVEEPYDPAQVAGFPSSALFAGATAAALDGLPCFWLWELRVDE